MSDVVTLVFFDMPKEDTDLLGSAIYEKSLTVLGVDRTKMYLRFHLTGEYTPATNYTKSDGAQTRFGANIKLDILVSIRDYWNNESDVKRLLSCRDLSELEHELIVACESKC